MRNRLRKFETLEARNLLAANPFISEINYSQLFGGDETQYVELRGAPGATMEDGTYLVIVDSDANDAVSGEIHGIFDLSGVQFGGNGFLVLLPMDSPFTPSSAANTLQSTAPGFGALPDDIYTDSHDLSDNLDFIFSNNSFFLIHSEVEPNLGDDIDVDNDGFLDPDGVFQDWLVHDSISTMWGLSDSHGYGSIVYVDSNAVHFPDVTALAETPVVRVNGNGYVGRVGNSTGSQPEDWVMGTITQDNDFQDYVVRLAGGTFGQPSIMAMHGRQLDHLGRENFTAAARVQYFVDDDRDGLLDEGESFLANVEVLADMNDNGIRDPITTLIEPNDFPEDVELNNLTPGVTLGVAGSENVLLGFPIEAAQLFGQPVGTHVFSNSGINFFSDGFRFRADFYRPATSVSIAIVGFNNSNPTYGRLDAFNADGDLIGTRTSAGLALNGRQTLTITRGTDDIAYVVAYPDLGPADASTSIRLDDFGFRVPEALDVTGDDGMATLNYLAAGDYTFVANFTGDETYLSDPVGFNVSGYRNYASLVPLSLNVPPVFESADFSVVENSVAGVEIGAVQASTHSTQSVTYELVSGDDLFAIHSLTGMVRVREGAVFDFESADVAQFRVRATDNATPPLSSEAEFLVQIVDINEPPSLAPFTFSVPESVVAGDTIGFVTATDPDADNNGLVNYRISGANPGQAVAVNQQTGELIVQNANYFNFADRSDFFFNIAAFDFGVPSLVSSARVTILIEDVNEPPSITTESMMIGELASPGDLVGTIEVQDPDPGQTFTFQWADGFATNLFVMDENTGEVRVAPDAILNYNSAPQHDLMIVVTDSGEPPLSDAATIIVSVLNENNLPVLLSAELDVDENAIAGTIVGTIDATDEDLAQSLVFAIVGGEDQSALLIDSQSGELRVSETAAFDFEIKSELQIVVAVTDNGQPALTSQRSYTIQINDINESPFVDALTEFTVAETTPANSELGTIVFGDPDDGDAPTIRFVESDFSDWFSIDPQTGSVRLTDAAALDFESLPEVTLTAEVTDGVNPPVTGTLRLEILDRNEPPIVSGDLEAINVLAGYEQTLVIADDFVTDPDAGQTLRWRLAGLEDDLPTWIFFDEPSRTITTAPWNMAAGPHDFLLVVTDNGDIPLSIEIPLTVDVQLNVAPWQNRDNPLDVNGDGNIRPLDALVVINYLNRASDPNVPGDVSFRPSFLDVNGNNVVEPIDALRIINELNRGDESEGESTMVPVPLESLHHGQTDLEERLRRRSQRVDQAIMELIRIGS